MANTSAIASLREIQAALGATLEKSSGISTAYLGAENVFEFVHHSC